MARTKRSRQDHGCSQNTSDAEARGRNDAASATITPTTQALSRSQADSLPTKRARLNAALKGGSYSTSPASETLLVASSVTDYLSSLSDELLIRILAYLSLPCLLSLAPVSRRFHRLADDSQLWKAIYYDRFVLSRVMRIPGFRGGAFLSTSKTTTSAQADARNKFGLSGNTEDADTVLLGRRNTSTVSGMTKEGAEVELSPSPTAHSAPAAAAALGLRRDQVLNWKQQYKLRHNWARGNCAVEELRLGGNRGDKGVLDLLKYYNQDEDEENGDQVHKMIVKVVDGIAVTADSKRGLRVWDLKSRSLVAGKSFFRQSEPEAVDTDTSSDATSKDQTHDSVEPDEHVDSPHTPTSLAVDATASGLNIAVGLLDGGFDIWQFGLLHKKLVRQFTHPASSSGSLTEIFYSHPYVLTATDSVLVSLYAFGTDRKPAPRAKSGASKPLVASLTSSLNPPHLLTSLRSHTSRPPLALSIRKLATGVVASIAYTFSTRQGWSIGIQDMHVKAENVGETTSPTVVTSRLAYSLPMNSTNKRNSDGNSSAWAPYTKNTRQAQHAPFPGSLRSRIYDPDIRFSSSLQGVASNASPIHRHTEDYEMDGPTALCYSHPYLLATMPDNTLILHLCTSSTSSLAISPGVRLWGHTSRISDAEITARGKAVSVSQRGEEIRVWELEGRPAAERGRSVAIRPIAVKSSTGSSSNLEDERHAKVSGYDGDERRNWVGFDDEMVIVLKESRRGQESLMVYDFT